VQFEKVHFENAILRRTGLVAIRINFPEIGLRPFGKLSDEIARLAECQVHAVNRLMTEGTVQLAMPLQSPSMNFQS
jgi:hypothetical protein